MPTVHTQKGVAFRMVAAEIGNEWIVAVRLGWLGMSGSALELTNPRVTVAIRRFCSTLRSGVLSVMAIAKDPSGARPRPHLH
jgi:hypothetical protein